MVFKTTFTSQRRARPAGFSLVEVLVALGLSGVLLTVCMSLTVYTARSLAWVTGSVDSNARSRLAVDQMSKKLRQASVINKFSDQSVTVTYQGKPLTYTYQSSPRKLVEIENGKTNTILKSCDFLEFDLYKRNPLTNSFNQFPVLTATNEAKVIQVNWRCSQTLLGKKSSSAEMVSAKIVIRAK